MNQKKFQKISILLLLSFNVILLSVTWIMMLQAYPHLPGEIPYWLNLAGQEVIRFPKSPIIFIYPAAQSLFLPLFWLLSSRWIKKPDSPGAGAELTEILTGLKKELVLLLMIFFNLIFIHIQRSLIWLAHGLGPGVNKIYFFSLIIIIFLLIPYYRFRRSLIIRMN